MGGFSIAEAVTSGGSKALALALVVVAFFKFAKWGIELVLARLDAGDKRLASRLKFVEIELDAYREVAMLLIGVVAKIDPDNPALVTCARILRTHPPRATRDVDEIAAKLNDIPATGGRA